MSRIPNPTNEAAAGLAPAPPVGLAARLRNWIAWCLPGLLSGLLLWLSFPPVDWGWVAWFALVPLATLVRSPWRQRPIYRAAWAGGLVFGLLSVHWIHYADDSGLTGYYGWLALGFYLSLYFPLSLLLARVAVLRFGVPAILALPITWVGLEYLRSWLMSGFPWYYLGHTQHHRTTLIQMADLAGAYGVSFVVALVNGWLLDVLGLPLLRPGPSGRRPAGAQVWRFGVVLAVVLGSMVYGRKCLNEAEVEPGPRVALVQTNIPQNVKVDDSREARERVRQQYRELIGAAVAARVDLLIWPETSYGDHFVQIDPQMTDDDVRRFCPSDDAPPEQVRKYAAEVRKDLQEFGQSLGTPVLWGLNFERMTVGKRSMYNSAVLVTPGGAISEPYHKIHLVPWGEYLPLADSLPWLHVFTPHASSDYGLDAGSEHVRFRFDRYSFGVLICFEDTLPDAARAYVSSDPVDMLVNISNDGWFRGSSELDAHLAISIFRAVECRRPLVRAVNTGISAIIDANGRVVQVAGSGFGPRKLSTDVVVGAVPLDRRASFYARAGDWLGWSCQYLTAAVLAAGMLVALARRGPRTQKR